MDTSGYFPKLTTDDPLYEIADYTALLKSKLEQRRHAEYSASITTGAGTLWDPGVFSVTTQSSAAANNTFVVPDVTGKIKFLEDGIYSLNIVIMSSTNPGSAFGLIKSSDNSRTYAATTNSNGAVWELYMAIPNLYVIKNDIIWFRMQTANAVNTTSRLNITKISN